MLRKITRLAFAVALATAGLASAAAAQSEPLHPYEEEWLARWGVTPADRYFSPKTELLKRVRVSKRIKEMVSAARDGDVIAWFLVNLELSRRCNGGRKVSRADCAALAHWLPPRRPPAPPLSAEMERFETFDPRAGDGPTIHAAEIGKLFELGIGGPRDFLAATYFFEMARALGSEAERAEANYRLGVMRENGLGKPKDPEVARIFYERAAKLGHATAAYMLASQPQDDSYMTPTDYLEIAADGGIADAAYRYARMIETGTRLQDLDAMIYKYYRIAALKGHVRAMSGVARAYWNGWGVPENERLAEEWWTRAARAGDGEAAYQVAKGFAQRRDYPGRLPWLRRAADAGVPGAGQNYNQWRAAGVREKSIGGSLLSALQFVADVGAEAEHQRQEELAVQEALAQATLAAIYASGAAGPSEAADAVGNSAAATTSSDAGSGDTQGGEGDGRRYHLDLVDSDNTAFEAELAAQRTAAEQSAAETRAAAARAAAQDATNRAKAQALAEQRRKASLIACHGSLEAAARAKATCQ